MGAHCAAAAASEFLSVTWTNNDTIGLPSGASIGVKYGRVSGHKRLRVGCDTRMSPMR